MSGKIYWIEDDAYIIGAVVGPLQDRGYKVVVIETMRDALRKIEDLRNCDLILLDIILPAGMGEYMEERYVGLALLEKLRDEGVETPVLAFTVVQNEHVSDSLKRLGVKGMLSKPVLPSTLEAKVLEILGEGAPQD